MHRTSSRWSSAIWQQSSPNRPQPTHECYHSILDRPNPVDRRSEMRVAFIASCALFGGAERVLLETIDVLRERGVDCRILLPGDGEFAQELRAAGVPYAYLSGGSWVSWSKPTVVGRIKAAVKIAWSVFRAARMIRAWQCDVVYSNTVTFCYGSVVARILSLPHVWHLHEFGVEDHGLFYHFGERFSNVSVGHMSSMCIVVSQALASKYGRYIESSKLRVVYPSMHRAPTEEAAPERVAAWSGSRRLRLIVVGGLVEGKGQVDAVGALTNLREAGVDAEVIMVGGGDPAYRQKLEELGRLHSLGDRLRFVGRVASSLPFIQASDVVVVTSRSEAFGRVTIEAMLAGKTVVGARSGATPELIQDGINGLLYESGSASDLAMKLLFLHEHPELLEKFGANGKIWAAKHFTRERYAGEIINVLASATSSGSGRLKLAQTIV